MSSGTTPSQTVGPFFHIGLAHLDTTELPVAVGASEAITIEGRVLDGDGAPVNDAVIEVWQADAHGRHDGRAGFGRIATDADGLFRFATIKPGRVSGVAGALQAPHLVVAVFMRGLLRHLTTRMYFPDDPGNANDVVLNKVPPERRNTLIARALESGGRRLEWNVRLQGEAETVFFDY